MEAGAVRAEQQVYGHARLFNLRAEAFSKDYADAHPQTPQQRVADMLGGLLKLCESGQHVAVVWLDEAIEGGGFPPYNTAEQLGELRAGLDEANRNGTTRLRVFLRARAQSAAATGLGARVLGRISRGRCRRRLLAELSSADKSVPDKIESCRRAQLGQARSSAGSTGSTGSTGSAGSASSATLALDASLALSYHLAWCNEDANAARLPELLIDLSARRRPLLLPDGCGDVSVMDFGSAGGPRKSGLLSLSRKQLGEVSKYVNKCKTARLQLSGGSHGRHYCQSASPPWPASGHRARSAGSPCATQISRPRREQGTAYAAYLEAEIVKLLGANTPKHVLLYVLRAETERACAEAVAYLASQGQGLAGGRWRRRRLPGRRRCRSRTRTPTRTPDPDAPLL